MDTLDMPLSVSLFPSLSGATLERRELSLRQLQRLVLDAHQPTKADLGLLKLAAFGDTRTANGSLRSNHNMLSIEGCEADYDQSRVTVDQAAALLRGAGLAALIYTSPSHMEDLPRWRVLCPTSRPLPPADRAALVGHLNAVLGGVLARESFTNSQAFYFGRTDLSWDHAAVLIDGTPIDTTPGLPDPIYPERVASLALSALPPMEPGTPPDARAQQALTAATALFADPDLEAKGRHPTLLAATCLVAPFVLAGLLDPREAADELEAALSASGRDANHGEVAGALRGALAKGRAFEAPTYGAEFGVLPPLPLASRRRVLAPGDCEGVTSRPYRVKGLLADRDVGCLFGPPGAGKSLLGPLLAYRLAQGEPFFGLRTRPGPTLYVAAEDESGMERRVNALRLAHGDASDFGLVKGVADLLNASSGDLEWLRAEVQTRRPALVVIDTLAMAFPGLIENDADAMGCVVAAARHLTKHGAAVLLIHHDSKARDGTPRGHSLLNGALDVAIALEPKDGNGVVRATLTKNRNGSCDIDMAFRIGVETLGVDQDGDPITAAIAVELSGVEAIARGPQLSTNEQAALDRLLECMTTVAVRAMDGTMAVPEDAWMASCLSLSTADTAKDRARSARRLRVKLLEKRVVLDVNGMFRPSNYMQELGPVGPELVRCIH